jgi:hypothetical protein
MIRGLHAMFHARSRAARFSRHLANWQRRGRRLPSSTCPRPTSAFIPPITKDSVGHRDISFTATILPPRVELESRGVKFTQAIEDHGYGLVTFLEAPGDFTVQLYQPKYGK